MWAYLASVSDWRNLLISWELAILCGVFLNLSGSWPFTDIFSEIWGLLEPALLQGRRVELGAYGNPRHPEGTVAVSPFYFGWALQ